MRLKRWPAVAREDPTFSLAMGCRCAPHTVTAAASVCTGVAIWAGAIVSTEGEEAGMGAADGTGESKPEEGLRGGGVSLQAAAFQMFRAVAGNPLAEGCRFVTRQRAEICGAFGKGERLANHTGDGEESVVLRGNLNLLVGFGLWLLL